MERRLGVSTLGGSRVGGFGETAEWSKKPLTRHAESTSLIYPRSP